MAIPTRSLHKFRVNSYNATPTALEIAIGNVALDLARPNLLGCRIGTDTTAKTGTDASRSIQLLLDTPPFIARANPPPLKAPATTWQGSIVSSSAEDRPGGLGASVVQVQYIDGNGNPQTQNVNLNGTTPVDIPSKITPDLNRVTVTDVVFIAKGLVANFGNLTIFSGLQKKGQAVGYVPQAIYHLIQDPNKNAQYKSLLRAWMANRMNSAMGMPVLWDDPVFS